MMNNSESEHTRFCITIQYDKEAANPEQIFLGMSRLIKSFREMDNTMIGCIDSHIEATLLLDDIEKGSLKVWLANVIKMLPDEGLKEANVRRVLGEFLVKAKYLVLEKLEGKDTFADTKDIEALEESLLNEAQSTNISCLDCYSIPARDKLLKSIMGTANALKEFREGDSLYIEIPGAETMQINKQFRLSEDFIEELCTGEIRENVVDVIIKVKKPDFLSDAQWSFKYGNKIFDMKILDEKWLETFQSGDIPVMPGDSLHVQMRTIDVYDNDGNLLSQERSVLRVQNVVRAKKDNQTILPLL